MIALGIILTVGAIAVLILFLMKLLTGLLLTIIALAIPALTAFACVQNIRSKPGTFSFSSMSLGLIASLVMFILDFRLAAAGFLLGIAAGIIKNFKRPKPSVL